MVAGFFDPSSASFFRRFITVGRNLVDKERSPGTCMHAVLEIILLEVFDEIERGFFFFLFQVKFEWVLEVNRLNNLDNLDSQCHG